MCFWALPISMHPGKLGWGLCFQKQLINKIWGQLDRSSLYLLLEFVSMGNDVSLRLDISFFMLPWCTTQSLTPPETDHQDSANQELVTLFLFVDTYTTLRRKIHPRRCPVRFQIVKDKHRSSQNVERHQKEMYEEPCLKNRR